MAVVYLGLGSNLGERLFMLNRSLELLGQEPGITVSAVSSFYETEPVGGPPQGLFLNCCACLSTGLTPVMLLRKLLAVEEKLGRVRRRRWEPRPVDLDLLLYDKLLMRTPSLELPHPRMTERDFVLVPLADIAPNMLIPGTGKTVAELLQARGEPQGVTLYLNNDGKSRYS